MGVPHKWDRLGVKHFTFMHLSLLPWTSSLCITLNFDHSCASTSYFHFTSLHALSLKIISISAIDRLSSSIYSAHCILSAWNVSLHEWTTHWSFLDVDTRFEQWAMLWLRTKWPPVSSVGWSRKSIGRKTSSSGWWVTCKMRALPQCPTRQQSHEKWCS